MTLSQDRIECIGMPIAKILMTIQEPTVLGRVVSLKKWHAKLSVSESMISKFLSQVTI